MEWFDVGEVSAVDTVNFTVDVDLNNGGKAKNIQVSSAYFDASTGCGFIFIPQEKALCLVRKRRSGEMYVSGFLSAAEAMLDGKGEPLDGEENMLPGYSGGRPVDWIQGEMGLVSPEGAYIKVGRGGLLSLVAGELCQLHMLPGDRNVIKLLADGFEIDSGSSLMSFVKAKENEEGNFTVVVQNYERTESSAFKIFANKNGAGFTWKAEKSFFGVNEAGDMNVDMEGGIVVTSGKQININNGNLVIKV